MLDEVANQRRDVPAAAAPGRRPEGYQRRGAGGVEGEELVEVGWGADPGRRALDLAGGDRGARDLRVEDAVFGAQRGAGAECPDRPRRTAGCGRARQSGCRYETCQSGRFQSLWELVQSG